MESFTSWAPPVEAPLSYCSANSLNHQFCNTVSEISILAIVSLKGSSGKYMIIAQKSSYIWKGSLVQFGAVKMIKNAFKS